MAASPYQLRTSGPCPCASGRRLGECCGRHRSGSLSAPVIRPTRVGQTPTGYAHPRCYARGLGDCDRKISGEHYVSESLLKRFAPDGDLTVAGLRMGGGRETALKVSSSRKINALRANVLCKRHNEMLSPLDAMIAAFFEATQSAPMPGTFVDNNGVRLRLFRGDAVEQWFVKLALGLLCSGNASFPGMASPWQPPQRLLDALFGESLLPRPLGLYAAALPLERTHLRVRFFAEGGGAGDIGAMECILNGVGFVLLFAEGMRINVKSVYRPQELRREEQPPAFVKLLWSEEGDREAVTLHFSGGGR